MTRIMTRTLFPVGNGIFCLERFENRHAVVYDCGSTSKKRIEHRVSELADRNDIDVIDYVFISHLHEDHVNGLPTLLEIFDVRRVVMSFMSEGDRDLLLLWRKLPQLQSNATPALDSYDFVDKLIIDPAGTVEGYSEGTEVSFVAPLDEDAEGEMAPTENANSRPFHVSGMPRAQKVSQSSIIKGEISLETDSSNECWQYVPFTIRYAEKTR